MAYLEYCSNCGALNETRKIDGRMRKVCPDCGTVHYHNPRPAVTVIAVQDSKLLLVKRAVEPAIGEWCLPGGFMEAGENTLESARRELLEERPPFRGGGEMSKRVQFDSFAATELPSKFEAGTPPIAQAVGFGAAVDYLSKLGMPAIRQHEQEMIEELKIGRFVACLDVTAPEPPAADSPLRSLPNVWLTPHEAGAVAQNLLRIGSFVADEIDAFVKGKSLHYPVQQHQLETIG